VRFTVALLSSCSGSDLPSGSRRVYPTLDAAAFYITTANTDLAHERFLVRLHGWRACGQAAFTARAHLMDLLTLGIVGACVVVGMALGTVIVEEKQRHKREQRVDSLLPLTQEDVANLASRLRGHAVLLPRTSERADVCQAADILQIMAHRGFLTPRAADGPDHRAPL
jgi:hypothetical protein